MNVPECAVCVYLTRGRKKIVGYKNDITEEEVQNIVSDYCENTVVKVSLEDLLSGKAKKTFFCG
jgi:hypothetical protein